MNSVQPDGLQSLNSEVVYAYHLNYVISNNNINVQRYSVINTYIRF